MTFFTQPEKKYYFKEIAMCLKFISIKISLTQIINFYKQIISLFLYLNIYIQPKSAINLHYSSRINRIHINDFKGNYSKIILLKRENILFRFFFNVWFSLKIMIWDC